MKWTPAQLTHLSKKFQAYGVDPGEAQLAAKTILEYAETPRRVTKRQLVYLVRRHYPILDIINWASWQARVEIRALREDDQRIRSMPPPERWKPILGYEGMYEVSDHGRVRSLKRGKVHLMRCFVWGAGYVYCSLSNGGRRIFTVHRLVAQAFHGSPPPGRDEINHIDGDKTNNRAANLEWCSRLENMRHASEKDLAGCPILQLDRVTGEVLGRFGSITKAARAVGCTYYYIIDCCKGRKETAGGYGWRYEEKRAA
jgi:hypothetical protein